MMAQRLAVSDMRRILLTGAAGRIGRDLARLLPLPGEEWRFCDILPPAEGQDFGPNWLQGDLADPAFAQAACAGVDAVIHMAGQPRERDWPELFGPNLLAAANLWEAARLQGVTRVIFGSSNHTTGMYPASRRLDGDAPPRPDSRYGVTKVFGEALASLYADKYLIRGFSIRIGTYRDSPSLLRELATWVSPRDLAALVRVGLEAEYHNERVYGVSANRRSWWDNSRAHALGYHPQDNAEDWADRLPAALTTDPEGPAVKLQGAGHAARDFAGDLARLLQEHGDVPQ